MRTIHLYGRLAEEFGSRFNLDVNSVAEAVRALEANFPDRFFRSIREGSYHLALGDDRGNGDLLDQTMLTFRFGKGDFHVTPAIAGAGGNGKGILTAVVGIAIVGAAIASGGALAAPLASSGLLSGITTGQAVLFGASLILSGVSTLLTPTPKVPDLSGTQDRKSFFFNSPINVIEQGGPVRVVYGQMRVGSTVISSGLDAESI